MSNHNSQATESRSQSYDSLFEAGDDLLWMQLKTIPAFRALLRSVEARFYHHIDLPGPILDVGSGDGHFSQMAFTRPLDVGIDPWWGPLSKSQPTGMYNLLVQGMGNTMPFPDATFASAISNSVLEHIPDVQAVLNETSRVLQPGGKFVITMPSHMFTEYMGGAALFEKLGASGLADQYRDFFNTISRHEHTDPPETWAARLAQAGFEIERWQYYFSRGALRALELGHVQGVPSAVMRALTGHWVVAPWQSSLRRTERWLRPFYEEETARSEGAYLLFVARKRADHAIDAPLPPQRPFTIAELRDPLATSEQPTTDSQRLMEPDPPVADPTIRNTEHAARNTEHGTRITEHDLRNTEHGLRNTDQAPPAPKTDTTSTVLILLSLLAAMIGQSIAGGDAPTRSIGWFLFAAVPLLLLGWRQNVLPRPSLPGWRRPSPTRLPRRRFLLLPALLLAFLAQGAGTAGTGRPFLAILLWLAGIGTTFYALTKDNDEQSTVNNQQPTNNEQPVTDDDLRNTDHGLRNTDHGLRNTDHGLRLTGDGLLIAGVLFLAAFLLRAINLTGLPFILNGIEASLGLDALNMARGIFGNPFATGWLSNPTLPTFVLSLPIRVLGPTVFAVRLLSPLIGAATVVATFLVGQRLYGRSVGVIAAVLLAGSHFHLHYSRLGITNIWDPLLALLALGLLAAAWHDVTEPDGQHRRWWLWAGLAIGLNAYTFAGSHLLPIMVALLATWALLFDRQGLRQNGVHLVAATVLAFIVALPQLLFYNNNPTFFMQRVDALSIWQTGWLAQEAARLGLSEWTVLQQQIGRSLLAFSGLLDKSPAYRPPVPLLGFGAALFFGLGLLIALLRGRQLRYVILPVWVVVTAVFAGAFLIELPSSNRLLIAAPALSLLAAVALVTYGRFLLNALTPRLQAIGKPWLLPALLALALLFVIGDVAFYYGRFPTDHNFGDRNTEVADSVAAYLNDLDGDWTTYFYGPPSMYTDFPTIPFLVQDFQRGVNMYDVAPGEERPLANTANQLFLILPENSDALTEIQVQYPAGTLETFAGYYADPLFYAYKVTP